MSAICERYEKCPICYEDGIISDDGRGQNESLIPSHGENHYVHVHCGREWYLLHDTCPICRSQLLPSEKDRFVLASPLIVAARLNNLQGVRRVLEQGVRSEERIFAIKRASRSGFTQIVQVLASGFELSDRDRIWSIWCAARGRSVPTIDALLDRDPLAIRHRGLAAYYAASENLTDVFSQLIQHGEILPEHWGLCANTAAEMGCRQIIDLMVPYPQFTQAMREQAAEIAGQYLHLAIEDYLRNTNPLGEDLRPRAPNSLSCAIL